MSIAEFSTKNPVFINLIMALILVLGLYSAIGLPLELFPSIELETVTVTTSYPGASAEDIEQLVSIPIEDEINDIAGIKVIRSISSEGRSVVVAEIFPREDISKIAEDIRSEISNIQGELPDDSEDPVVEEVEPRFPVLSISIAGKVPREMLRTYAKRLENDLKLISGVDSIVTSGLGDPVFWVRIDPLKVLQYNISLEAISAAIAQKNIDLPSGAYKQGDVEFLVRTRGRIQTPEDLLDIPVRRSPEGMHVLLRDVATIELGEQKSLTTTRVNGLPAITYWVNKQPNADAVDIVGDVRLHVDRLRATLPAGVDIFESNDSSYWVQQRFNTMVKSGIIGLCFVLIVLAAFLDLRAASLVALGIPISFFGAFILMAYTGVTLNVLSMFGLIMVLGIIVDDAIIVVENIQRYMQGGMSAMKAAVVGTNEVARPVLATILTNIAAFLPLLLATGLIGKFLSVIPTVAIYALAISIVEAMIILPSHCADFLKPPRGVVRSRRWVVALRRKYLQGLYFSIRNRYVVVGSFVLVLMITAGVLKSMPLVLFYVRDINQFIIKVQNPTWSSIENTQRSVGAIEEVIESGSPPGALKNTLSMVGLDLTRRAPVFGDHLASIFVELEDFDKREENGLDIMRGIRKRTREEVVGPVIVDFQESGGPPTGKAVDVRIQGADFSTLKQIAGGLETHLEAQKGVFGVSDDLVWGKPEIRVSVDERRASLYGLDTRTVARAVRSAVDGLTVAKTRIGTEEADINLLYDFPRGELMNLLETYQIATPGGSWVPLEAVATLEVNPSMLTISRYDMKRAIRVTADIDQNITTSSDINSGIEGYITAALNDYPGYSHYFGGEEEETRESIRSIFKAAILSVLIIYSILASMLRSYTQPLIIMSVLPFALVGVVIGLLLRGDPMSMPALIGVVALLGIVVNDSLVLMDFINRRRKNLGRISAVARSARHRFRPIVLTTVTTFGGLASLMVQTRGEAAFLAPMAIALGFGLVFATLITLYLIPSLYLILDDAHIYVNGLWGRDGEGAVEKPDEKPGALKP